MPKIITIVILIALLATDVYVVLLAQNSFTYFDKFNEDQALNKEIVAPSLLKKEEIEAVFNVLDSLTLHTETNTVLDTRHSDPFVANYSRDSLIFYLEESTKKTN